MTATQGGKGSKPRPVDKKKFDENWDKIFGKKNETVIFNGHGSHATNTENDSKKSLDTATET